MNTRVNELSSPNLLVWDWARAFESHPEYRDMRVPQKSFEYPWRGAEPVMGAHEDPSELLLRWLPPRGLGWNPFATSLSLQALFSSWISYRRLENTTVGVIDGPVPSALLSAAKKHGVRLHFLSPQTMDWSDAELAQLSGVYLESPNSWNGFFWSQEMVQVASQRLLQQASTVLLVNESQALFSFVDTAPGKWSSMCEQWASQEQDRLDFLGAMFPSFTPRGPKLLWLSSKKKSIPQPVDQLSREEALHALRALQAFEFKQGAAIQEFHRRMLALKFGLRLFGDSVSSALKDSKLSVPIWPDSGFYMELDLSLHLARRSWDSATWAKNFAQATGYVVEPGEAHNRPSSVFWCFACTPELCKKFGEALADFVR